MLSRSVSRIDLRLEKTNIGVGLGGYNESDLHVGMSGLGQVSLDGRNFFLENHLVATLVDSVAVDDDLLGSNSVVGSTMAIDHRLDELTHAVQGL